MTILVHRCYLREIILTMKFRSPHVGQSNETEQDEQKEEKRTEENTMDFAANIEKVKEVNHNTDSMMEFISGK